MYEKKLRQLFRQSRTKAEQALEDGNHQTAATYYRRCGDILAEQAKDLHGEARKRKQELSDQFYELSANVSGESDSMRPRNPGSRHSEPDEQDFSGYVERFKQDSSVTWDDVAGLEDTKEAIRESFALAAIEDKPAAVESMQAILLYGPPGTGKSLLASAVAGSNAYTFFNVKLSHALSKYYGESGKIISELFAAARREAPSVLFFDEIDAVAMKRGDDLDETSRRVLSTLLTELSGLGSENDDVLVIAATNAPWDLDPAVQSRMERLIYVPLPDETTAEKIIALNTVEQGVELAVSLDTIAADCVERGYSGREISALCREAVRHMVDAENPDLEALSDRPIEEIKQYSLQTVPLTREHFEHAFERIAAKSDPDLLVRYQRWGA